MTRKGVLRGFGYAVWLAAGSALAFNAGCAPSGAPAAAAALATPAGAKAAPRSSAIRPR